MRIEHPCVVFTVSFCSRASCRLVRAARGRTTPASALQSSSVGTNATSFRMPCSMRQVTLERDINIAINGCSGFATSSQKEQFTAMLISHSGGTYLILTPLSADVLYGLPLSYLAASLISLPLPFLHSKTPLAADCLCTAGGQLFPIFSPYKTSCIIKVQENWHFTTLTKIP